jgi:GNAT superfamily N-acetyltransferase
MLKGFFMETLNQNVLDEYCSYLKNKYKNIIKQIQLDECTDEEGRWYIYLVNITIKKSQRNKGYGAAVMSEITALADKYNVRIRLYATNIFGSELNRLYGFYQKLGFILNKKCNDGEMLYYPRKIVTKSK